MVPRGEFSPLQTGNSSLPDHSDRALLERLALVATYRATALDSIAVLKFVFKNALDPIAPLSVAVWSNGYEDGWNLQLSVGSQMSLPQGYSSWLELNQASILQRRVIAIQVSASRAENFSQTHWIVPLVLSAGQCYVLHVLAGHDSGTAEAIEPFLSVLAHLVISLDPSQPVCSNYRSVSVGRKDTSLTSRQNEVLQLLAMDLTYSQIAFRMRFSESTVKQEAMKIFRKLGVSNRAEAVRKI